MKWLSQDSKMQFQLSSHPAVQSLEENPGEWIVLEASQFRKGD
jgi:hypothetical protein